MNFMNFRVIINVVFVTSLIMTRILIEFSISTAFPCYQMCVTETDNSPFTSAMCFVCEYIFAIVYLVIFHIKSVYLILAPFNSNIREYTQHFRQLSGIVSYLEPNKKFDFV